MSTLILRDDQQAAVDAIDANLSRDGRALHVSACGTGKTIVAIALAARRGRGAIGGRALVLVPNLALLDQTIKAWQHFHPGIKAAIVCSDDTVGARPDDDVLQVDESSLSAPVLHEIDGIREWIEGCGYIFATYQSVHLVAEAAAPTAGFDLIVADEAHWLAGRGRSTIRRQVCKTICARARLFQTATPRVGSTTGLDNPDLFGHVAYELTFGQAIALGIIADYRLVILDMRGDIPAGIAPDRWRQRAALTKVVLERLGKDAAVARTLVYANRVAHAREIARANGVEVITGDMPAARRDPIMAAFREHGGTIANVRCLNEGVDVPDLDAVVFAEPRRGIVDITQSIGRVLRRKSDGRRGIVVLPVFSLPESDEDPWSEIMKTLETMQQMDGRLTQALTDALTGEGGEGSDGGSDGTDGPVVDISGAPDDLLAVLRERVVLKDVTPEKNPLHTSEEIHAFLLGLEARHSHGLAA